MSDTESEVGSIVEDASDAEELDLTCLFCPKQLQSVPSLFKHGIEEHGFDLETKLKELASQGLAYSLLPESIGIKLVNYLRQQTSNGAPVPTAITLDTLDDDKLMMPVMEDDALLFSLGDFIPEDPKEKAVNYQDLENLRLDLDGVDLNVQAKEGDKRYFDSYKAAGIHREMIEDRVRTQSYRKFIESFPHFFKDATILDVGCGTGILSLFCARVGAKKVYAVDASPIAATASKIVALNGYSNVVQVIQGRVEDDSVRKLIQKASVDVIISEWMGYGLLFEGMLDSVLKARDLYLKPDGHVFPNYCTLCVAPAADKAWSTEQRGEKFWKEVEGFNFAPMVKLASGAWENEIAVLDVPDKVLAGQPVVFKTLDIKNLKVPDLNFVGNFEIKLANRDLGPIDAFIIYFDTFFLSSEQLSDLDTFDSNKCVDMEPPEGIAFSTSPASTLTHWQQAVLFVDPAQTIGLEKGDILKGSVRYSKIGDSNRGIQVQVNWDSLGGGSSRGTVTREMDN
ncbi:S-adenosyl-L-methionine-dependent methyltransferase [Polyplosphaeria fusca]|uniref:type I protein arginine methyltransferase n=1 Tax=Polyplosphaeria fusca TaxID=682080 RepID=A0A9P4R2R9_9PLEO|nr:S-adenosyl-L-methionine-dependent methyltransferase [Polyplosphaeria fusca]